MANDLTNRANVGGLSLPRSLQDVDIAQNTKDGRTRQRVKNQMIENMFGIQEPGVGGIRTVDFLNQMNTYPVSAHAVEWTNTDIEVGSVRIETANFPRGSAADVTVTLAADDASSTRMLSENYLLRTYLGEIVKVKSRSSDKVMVVERNQQGSGSIADVAGFSLNISKAKVETVDNAATPVTKVITDTEARVGTMMGTSFARGSGISNSGFITPKDETNRCQIFKYSKEVDKSTLKAALAGNIVSRIPEQMGMEYIIRKLKTQIESAFWNNGESTVQQEAGFDGKVTYTAQGFLHKANEKKIVDTWDSSKTAFDVGTFEQYLAKTFVLGGNIRDKIIWTSVGVMMQINDAYRKLNQVRTGIENTRIGSQITEVFTSWGWLPILVHPYWTRGSGIAKGYGGKFHNRLVIMDTQTLGIGWDRTPEFQEDKQVGYIDTTLNFGLTELSFVYRDIARCRVIESMPSVSWDT